MKSTEIPANNLRRFPSFDGGVSWWPRQSHINTVEAGSHSCKVKLNVIWYSGWYQTIKKDWWEDERIIVIKPYETCPYSDTCPFKLNGVIQCEGTNKNRSVYFYCDTFQLQQIFQTSE